MADDTITFDLIRRIQREEQRSPKLAEIPENFYDAAMSYINQKRQIGEDRKGVLEVKSIERLIEDIFDRRERKIVTAAVNTARTNIQPENMIEEEKDFFDLVAATIRQRREAKLRTMFTVEKGEKEDLLVFKDSVPEFVGSDMKNYGPFKKGDIAKLPDENAKILIEKGLVEQFKVTK
jgi:DNA replication factor GINS